MGVKAKLRMGENESENKVLKSQNESENECGNRK